MDQNPAPLLQTPEQWPLLSELDTSFSSAYFAADDLQAYAIQNRTTIMPEPYCPQPTADLMFLDMTIPGPDASLGLGLGWSMDLVDDDLSILACYGGSGQENPRLDPRTGREVPGPPNFLLLADRAVVSKSADSHTAVGILAQDRMSAKPTDKFVSVGVEDSQSTTRSLSNPQEKTGSTHTESNNMAHPSKPPPPLFNAISWLNTGKASAAHVQARAIQDDGPPLVDGGLLEHPKKKHRQYSATPSAPPSSGNASSSVPSASVARLSRRPHQAAPFISSQGRLPLSRVPSVVAVPKARRGNVTCTSAEQQKHRRWGYAAGSRGNEKAKRASIAVSEYQMHVMNLIEFIKRERLK
ncbi:hypothetical protein CGRA01v4_15080 [Colletotrichum graminicola]|nr:hypothetical protein CGRA01v4_15080 [Colletotrichum graminicola]